MSDHQPEDDRTEDPEVPEADAQEQRQPVTAVDEDAPALDTEVPEADALEQSRTVDSDDDYEP